MQHAYLVGLAAYPNHALAGVPNDLALIRRGLERQGFDPTSIQTFGDTTGTLADLRHVLTLIGSDFGDATADPPNSHCFFYFSGSGLLSVDPLLGGIKPLDGDDLDFRTALAFTELNRALPIRPGLQVTVVLDCWHSNLAADSLSADITYLALGGREKTACTTGDVAISVAPGQVQMHGQLSWVFGTTLCESQPGARWSDLLAMMTDLIDQQGLALELTFHGRPTARFHG